MTNVVIEYSVDYIDEMGVRQSETWTERTLNEWISSPYITITHIELSYNTQKRFGLVEED